jgi:hypothetical protein
MELELMEVTCEAHPLAFMKRPAGAVPIADMPERGQSLIWGRVPTRKSLKGGAGFLMVEDETGIADVFAPSPWYRKASVILRRPVATLLLRCERTAERTVVLKVLE